MGLAYGQGSTLVGLVDEEGLVYRVLRENHDLVENVEKTILNNYIGSSEIDDEKIFYGMMSGLVAGLDDPYSEYFSPEESRLFWEDVNGEYEGIGIEITLKDGGVYILSVIDGSPADLSGIMSGDIVLSVDDSDVEGMKLGEIASMIKGEKGSVVTLLLLRGSDLLEVSVERDRLEADSVYVEMDDNILWVAIQRFDDDTDVELTNKLQDFDINSIRGIILDVRGNPGGYFDTAVEVADDFLSEGLIVSEKMATGQSEEYLADSGDSLERVDLVVLIDAYSASAAEILAGAIKDHDRGEIVGQKSYGKGSVQIIEDLKDGSILKLTIAEWLTPSGQNLRHDGIEPDYVVANDSLEIDSQYQKAKEILTN